MGSNLHSRLPLIAAGILLALAACSRPTGDFGRARPSVINDEIMPAIGRYEAGKRGEPVSDFNLTDTEQELRDRAWNFIRAPHAADWTLDREIELQRTRINPETDAAFDPQRYYSFLREDPYRSSEGRWSRVIQDAQADTALIPPFCAVASRVRRTDVERLAALERSGDASAEFSADAYARVAENNLVMERVWRALAYRTASYRFAIDRMQVETPSDQLFATNQAVSALAATRCREAPAMRVVLEKIPRAPRVDPRWDPFDAPVPQK